jgi:hypothetical protein
VITQFSGFGLLLVPVGNYRALLVPRVLESNSACRCLQSDRIQVAGLVESQTLLCGLLA